MKYAIIAIAALLLVIAHAQQGPQPNPLSFEIVDGRAGIGFANDAEADTAIVTLEGKDCAGMYTLDPQEPQVALEVPAVAGDACLLKLGDRVTVALFRDKVFLGIVGPFVARGQLYFPLTMRE